MIAELLVSVEAGRVVRLAASPPLAAKVLAGSAGPEVLVVGAAASLLEGDRLTVRLVLGPGASLTVRTVAATLAHPCPGGGTTSFAVDADLGPGAQLVWLGSPLVACAGCHHAGRARVRLAEGAAAVWSETTALGRCGEEPGRVAVRLDADVVGAPLLRDGLRVGPPATGWSGPAVLDGARHVGSVALLGRRPPRPAPGEAGPGGAVLLPLAGRGAVVRATAGDAATLERHLAPWRAALIAGVLGDGASLVA